MSQFTKIYADSCKNKTVTTLGKKNFTNDIRLGDQFWKTYSNGKIDTIYSKYIMEV